jgi:hypothetical protein
MPDLARKLTLAELCDDRKVITEKSLFIKYDLLISNLAFLQGGHQIVGHEQVVNLMVDHLCAVMSKCGDDRVLLGFS